MSVVVIDHSKFGTFVSFHLLTALLSDFLKLDRQQAYPQGRLVFAPRLLYNLIWCSVYSQRP